MGKPSFSNVIINMEKISVSKSIWKTGIFKPGIFEHTKFDEVLANVEK